MIELFGMSSPNVRKIVIALEEMAVPYRITHVGVFRGQQFDDEFLALNPLAKVPVILDPDGPGGNAPIFESGAILIYLAETYGATFLPPAGQARYVVLKWLVLQVASMGPALGNHSHFRLISADNEYAATRFRRMSAQVYRALDQRLAQAEYFGGNFYSIADMAIYPWARYLHRHGMHDEDCPNIVDWIRRIAARPAVQRAAKVIDDLGVRDAEDRATATVAERERFKGSHIPAPTAVQAAAASAAAVRMNSTE